MRTTTILLAATLLLGLVATGARGAPTPATATKPAGDEAAATPRATAGPRYDLRQLVQLARASYPGIAAAQHSVRAMERDVYRAKWAWLPQGNVRGILAPAPELRCSPSTDDCRKTNAVAVNSFNVGGIMARIELEIGMPVWTFGKLTAARQAAGAGLEIRRSQVRMTEDRVVHDVTRAYWGLKLAREILETIREGRTYITDAEEKIEQELEAGEGDYTLTDLLRLKSARAEVDIRIPEAEKLERLTLAALATLTGLGDKPFDVDTKLLDVIEGEPLPVREYLRASRQSRPEVFLLAQAIKARSAAVDLERARFFPDFLFVAMLAYAKTTGVDQPSNAFYNNPFNTFGGGFGLALSWKWDQFQQYGQYRKAQAEEDETRAREREALSGIDLEIKKAWTDLEEARARREAAARGEKTGRRWLVAVSQNLAAGLAETRDLTDALLAFFQMRLRHLQAMYDVNAGWSELGRTIGAAAAARRK